MKQVIAVFDFDGTITKRDSFLRFLLYYTTPMALVYRTLLSLPTLVQYFLKRINNSVAKERLFVIFFANEEREKFEKKARNFGLNILPTLVKKAAMEKIKWHAEQKHLCVLVSASIEDYLVPWAERNGFSHVLATTLESGSGRITGKFKSSNCYGYEKINRLREHLGALKEYELYAYGDSRGDKELLELADHPFYRSFTRENSYPAH